jgi:hypothetical protein
VKPSPISTSITILVAGFCVLGAVAYFGYSTRTSATPDYLQVRMAPSPKNDYRIALGPYETTECEKLVRDLSIEKTSEGDDNVVIEVGPYVKQKKRFANSSCENTRIMHERAVDLDRDSHTDGAERRVTIILNGEQNEFVISGLSMRQVSGKSVELMR